MKYRRTYTIQYQDVDVTRRIRLHTLENCLLNVAAQVADQIGFGIPDLLPLGYTWIITRLNLEMLYAPRHGEVLDIETWVEQNAHMLSVRNYRIYLRQPDGSEQLIGCAKSVWAILDLEKREIVNVFDLPMFAGAVDGEVLNVAKPVRLLPIDLSNPSSQAQTGIAEHAIQYADVDYNRHCNSCRYLEWMSNTCLWEDTAHPFRLDINYMKELHLGEQMTTRYRRDSQSVQYQQIDSGGTTCCTARIAKIDNLSC